MHVSKIIIVKGLTTEDREQKRWVRVEYTMEMTLRENEDPENAKQVAETLIDSWLKSNPKQAPKQANIGKKTCTFRGCDKQIDPKYNFCYTHFQKVRGKS